MDAKILYEIYTTTRDMGLKDLTFGLGQYHADHPGAISHDQDKAIREFMGRHGQALARAYPGGYEAFAAAVVQGMAEDKTAQEAHADPQRLLPPGPDYPAPWGDGPQHRSQ